MDDIDTFETIFWVYRYLPCFGYRFACIDTFSNDAQYWTQGRTINHGYGRRIRCSITLPWLALLLAAFLRYKKNNE